MSFKNEMKLIAEIDIPQQRTWLEGSSKISRGSQSKVYSITPYSVKLTCSTISIVSTVTYHPSGFTRLGNKAYKLFTTALTHWNARVAINYTNWHSGQPDNFGNVERCGMLYADGTWNDASCSNSYWFVCEIPLSHCDGIHDDIRCLYIY
nr:uncharacterized protein LOC123759170 [Procambarus clarkii]